jgi:hypothetical protein
LGTEICERLNDWELLALSRPSWRVGVVLTDKQWAVLEPFVEVCRPPAKYRQVTCGER